MNKIILLSLFSMALAGCSDRQLYRAGQDYQKNKCIQEAITQQQYSDCLNMNKSYNEYDIERNIIISK